MFDFCCECGKQQHHHTNTRRSQFRMKYVTVTKSVQLYMSFWKWINLAPNQSSQLKVAVLPNFYPHKEILTLSIAHELNRVILILHTSSSI